MSRLKQLIAKLCPEDVEYIPLGKVLINNNAPNSISKKDYKDTGRIPIIDQSQSYVAAYTDDESAIPPILPCIIFGDHTRVIKYADNKFAQGDSGTKVFIPITETYNTKYVYYAFSNLDIPSRGYNRHWTVVKDIKIPLPPLQIQEEIVDILDKLTMINQDLVEKLTQELIARKKQYDYYRDLLLTFDDEIEWKTLGDVAKNLDSKRKPITKGNRKAGEFPYYGASGIVDYVSDYIFDGEYLLVSEDGANLVSRVTPIAFSASGKIWVNNHAHVLEFKTYIERKFIEYYLNMIDLSRFISTAAQPKLTQENLNKIPVPVPSLIEQERIVSILDRYDTICNTLSKELSAEIEARQKQYEYYRDKLLTFKEVIA